MIVWSYIFVFRLPFFNVTAFCLKKKYESAQENFTICIREAYTWMFIATLFLVEKKRSEAT